ncbi:MAG: ATP-binding protein [Rhodospirillaceae bacterium]|nr:ATP-binding protein [Rhodospirillaceae bacterium]
MADHGTHFVAPFEGREQLLQDDAGAASIALVDPMLEAFMVKRAQAPLGYGYPLHIDQSGQVSPLFYGPASLRLATSGRVVLERRRDAPVNLNRALLAQYGVPSSAIARLTQRLERGPRGFGECLGELARIVGVQPAFDIDHVQPLPPPKPGAEAGIWSNTPIVFADLEGASQGRLLDELKLVERGGHVDSCVLHELGRPKVADDGASADVDPMQVMPLVPVSLELMSVLRSCLASRMSVVEAPPGGGKYALIVDLLASACASGRSSLFVAARRPVVDHVAHQLQSRIAPDCRWIVPLAGADAARSDFLEAQRRFAMPDPTASGSDGDPQRSEEGLASADLDRQLAQMQALADQVVALRDAVTRVTEAQASRLAHERERQPEWSALFTQDTDYGVDAVQLNLWQSEAAELAGSPPAGRQRNDDKLRSLTQSLFAALAKLPADRRAALPLPAMDGEALAPALSPDTLLEAFTQLHIAIQWQQALHAERAATEAWVALSPSVAVARQLGSTQLGASKAAQWLLAHMWQAAMERAGAAGADLVEEVFRLVAMRAAGETQPDPKADMALATAIAEVSQTSPIWTVTANAVRDTLPPVPGLFDVIVIDDAEDLDGATLLAILLRARSAVVLGSLANADRSPEEDGLGMALSLLRSAPLKIVEHRRCHPRIARFLSDAYHEGGLHILLDRKTLQFDALHPQLAGLHWHAPSSTDASAVSDVTDAVHLVTRWRDAGVLSGSQALSLAVVSPFPRRVEQLARRLTDVLPRDYVAKSLVVGTPQALRGRVTDLLVMLPGIARDMPTDRARLLAQNPGLYHDAVGAARLGVHVIANEMLCREAGGPLALLYDHCAQAMGETDPAATDQVTTAVAAMARTLGLHALRTPDGLALFSVFGRVYDLALGGPEPDDPLADRAVGRYRLVLDPREVLETPERVRNKLARLG